MPEVSTLGYEQEAKRARGRKGSEAHLLRDLLGRIHDGRHRTGDTD